MGLQERQVYGPERTDSARGPVSLNATLSHFPLFQSFIWPSLVFSYKMGIFRYEDISTETIFVNSVKGAKEFLLNEPPEASRNARIRLNIFVVVHNTILIGGGLLLGRFLLHRLYDYYQSNY